ncbi:hypothetical protein A7K91_00100 [Paenibacillus oryzae]|uniref:Uncharacterized protein n=1 Tax=Paenibacillus oryzae TaxID=1844972 RepID=A0A1A5YMT8_9BACL|nr:hypothetical protein [Paenibacillus oryzae]OBR66720.1 hypothetical protein A7K91_00100 [Paenibacillus oryzae]
MRKRNIVLGLIISTLLLVLAGCGTANEIESVKETVTSNIMRKYDDASNIIFSKTDVSRMRETVSTPSGQYAEATGTFEIAKGKKRFSYVLEKFGKEWDIQIFKTDISDY